MGYRDVEIKVPSATNTYELVCNVNGDSDVKWHVTSMVDMKWHVM